MKKELTAFDIWATYEYWNHKSMMQENAYPKGQVEEWTKKFVEFSKKRFVCLDDIDDMPKKKFAGESIDSPKNRVAEG